MTRDIWVLTDEKTGHTNQSLGVAEALGWPMQIKKISYSSKADLPNFWLGASLKGADLTKSDKIQDKFPDLVIATGRRLVPISKWIKKASKGKTKIVQLMWPGFPAWGFDLIAAPAHDRIKPSKKVIVTLGSPHRISPVILQREAETWANTLLHSGANPPYISLLIRASVTEVAYNDIFISTLANFASKIASLSGATLLISNSRRTPEATYEKLLSQITVPKYVHDVNKSRANPYLGFIGISLGIIATGDSVSMMSEACGSGKKLLIGFDEQAVTSKHIDFINQIISEGYAKTINEGEENEARDFLLSSPEKSPPPLNPSKQVAEAIRNLYK